MKQIISAFEDNAKCIAATGKAERKRLDENLETFLKKAEEDHSGICQFSQTYINGWVSPYKETCKGNVGQALCETAIVGLHQFLPTCQYTCPKA